MKELVSSIFTQGHPTNEKPLFYTRRPKPTFPTYQTHKEILDARERLYEIGTQIRFRNFLL